MTSVLAAATVVRGDERHDIAVPTGTTVAGILAMLRIDTSDRSLIITRADGVRVALDDALGRELPSGAILACATSQLAVHGATIRRSTSSSSWVDSAIVSFSTVVLVVLWELAVFVVPAVRGIAVPMWASVGSAVVCVALVASLLRWPDVADAPWGAVLLPPLLGVAVGGAVPTATSLGLSGAVTVAAGATAVGGTLLWMWRGSVPSAFAALGWIAAAVTVAVSVAVGAHYPSVALVVSGAVVAGLSLLPDHALRFPSWHLLNFPFLAMRASNVRSPELPEPPTIDGRSVGRSLDDAHTLLTTATWWGSLLLVVLLPLSLRTLHEADQWFAVSAFVLMVVALSLLPGQQGSATLQIVPRLTACILAIACVWELSGVLGLPSLLVAGVLAVAGFLIPLAVAATTGRPASAFMGHLADVWRHLSLVGVVPVSLVGAHLIDYVWRLA